MGMNKLLPYRLNGKPHEWIYTTTNYDNYPMHITFRSDGTVYIYDAYNENPRIPKSYYEMVLKQVRAIWGEDYTPKLTNIQLI